MLSKLKCKVVKVLLLTGFMLSIGTGAWALTADNMSSTGMSSSLFGLVAAAEGKNSFIAAVMNNTISAEEAAKTIEGAAKVGTVGNVAASLTSVGSASASNTTARTSVSGTYIANATSINYNGEKVESTPVSGMSGGMKSGIGMWIMPMYQNHSASGFESGSFEYGYDSNFYGVSVGADLTTPNNFRIGAAFSIGSGTSDSTGDFADTKNDFDYYGFSFYGGYHFDNLAISADVGYTLSDNDIEQDNIAGNISGDSEAALLSAGLLFEYFIATESIDIIPYVGIRLNTLYVDSFDTKFQGATIFKTDEVTSTTVQFPVGVGFAKSFDTSGGWSIRPSAETGVLFTTGDTSITQDTRIPGVASSASMDSDVYDATTFQGGLGVLMSNGELSLALDYNLNASEHVISHGVFGTLRYEF